MSSNCCGCGGSNGFEDHGLININPTAILRFINGDRQDWSINDRDWFICQSCARLATAAWAREFRRKNQINNPPPSPTNSPAGSGTVYVEQMAAIA